MADIEATLTGRQRLAIVAILKHGTNEEAAAAVNVAPRTIYRWLATDTFHRELVKARSKLIAGVLTDLCRASGDAVKVLRDIATSKRAPAAPRVAAARAILDLTSRHEEMGTLAGRLDELEAALTLANQTPKTGGGRWQ